jgi:multidrug efflux pump subunit AcrB
MWIVRLALNRPYTFIVLAILILIAAPVLILRTPTDIFPNINIPVVSIAWQYTGLSPDDLEGRLTTPYEKTLTTLVDNVQHVESTTLDGQAARHPTTADHQLLRLQRPDPAARALRPGLLRAATE